jgi:aspartokinase-like uncharacterized kinase
MSLKRTISNHALIISLLLFIIGIILTLWGILGVFVYDSLSDSVKDFVDSIGDWIYWCILAGPLILIAGGWYFFDNIKKRKEFKELMETTSKAKFIRNMDRAEFLAWRLTMDHQRQLMDKKKEFHIKK